MMNTESKVTLCEQIIDYRFKDPKLCLEALQTSGEPLLYYKDETFSIKQNKRFAVLGDTMLKTHLCKIWINTKYSIGQWSLAEGQLVCNRNLGAVGRAKGLAACMLLNPGMSAPSDYMVATTVEALIAAIYKDGGDEQVARFIDSLQLDHQYLNIDVVNLNAEKVDVEALKRKLSRSNTGPLMLQIRDW